MTERKLVTLVTPTWKRPKTILEHAIPSVARQTYPEIEHIIITDGYDPELNEILRKEGYMPGGHRKKLVWLGRNWSGFIGRNGMGDVGRLVGSYMAEGEYIGYLCDDNDLREDHVQRFVDLMETDNLDIVMCPWDQNTNPRDNNRVDANTFLHRFSLLKNSSWNVMDGREADHYLVERWINDDNASWGFHMEWTVQLNRVYGGHGAPDPD